MKLGWRVVASRVVARTFVVMSVIGAAVAVLGPASPVAATPVAPLEPLPACVHDDDGTPGLGCAPDNGQFSEGVEGLFGVGNTFTVITTGADLAWCHHYRQTGCVYSLGEPTILRCVYLHEEDPNDVRSCGTDLSTTGPIAAGNAHRQGTCRGELGSTYAYGGPATDPSSYWDARAPKLARCQFKVESPHQIDKLRGPTFFLAATHVGECVQEFGAGCDEASTIYAQHTRYVWVPVHGTLAPRVSFEWADGNDPGEIRFDNTSVPFDGAVTWDWDFDDDDAYSTEFEPTHTYAESGVYRVELTMTGPLPNQTLTTTRNVVVNLENADLLVKVYDPGVEILPDDSGVPDEPGYELGDLFVARIEVYNVSDDDAYDVQPSGPLLSTVPQAEPITAFPPVTPFALEPGQSKSYSVQMRVVDIGRFTLASTWTGRDRNAAALDARTGELKGVVKGPDLAPMGDLTVTVEPDPVALETDGPANVAVSTRVTIKNASSDRYYSEVALSGPLGWTPLYSSAGLATVELAFTDPGAVTSAFGPDDEIELGPLGPGESHTYDYSLVVTGDAHARLRQLVRAETPTGSTYRVGTRHVRIGGPVADAEPVVPARLLDTRTGPEFPTADGQMQGIGRLLPGTVTELPVLGRGGIDPDAPAVMLNVTAINPDGPGFLTVFPCGEQLPTASNVNYTGGQVVPNQVLAKVGQGGKVCIYTLVGTDLIVDANGYVPFSGELDPIVPARLLETRPDGMTADGQQLGAGRVAPGSVTEVTVRGRGGISADAAAVVLNVTAVMPDDWGYLTVFPCGEPTPNASNVNYRPGAVVPNSVVTKVGVDGKVCIYSLVGTDLIVDANGFVPAGGELTTLVPARLLETRPGETTVDGESQGAGRAPAGSVTEVRVVGRGGVLPGATTAFLNVTAVAPDGPGYLTVFPCGEQPPTASNVNYGAGDFASNAVLAKIGQGGKVCIFTLAAADLVVDVNGFVPGG